MGSGWAAAQPFITEIIDATGDGAGNFLTGPRGIANGTSQDCNANTIPDECDIAGTSQDSDGDGVPNECDGCPTDPQKLDPGACGCGSPETDTDGDGTADCNDNCPNDPAKTNPGELILYVAPAVNSL